MKSKTIQKVLAVILALGLLISYIPATVTAETVVAQTDQTTSKFADLSTSRTIDQPEETILDPVPLLAGSMAYAIEVRSTDNMYKIPDLDVPGTWQVVGPTTNTYYAADFLEDDFSKIYAVSDADILYTIDTTSGVATQIMALSTPDGNGFQGIAGAEGFFYGTSSDCSTNTKISTLDPLTGTITVIATTSIACGIDIAYAPDKGLLYVVDIITDHLYSIDPLTAAVVDVGALGFAAGYAQGMDYDEQQMTLYWAAYGSGGNGQLRTINTDTGASTLVGAFPGDNETDCLSIASYAGGDYEMNGTVTAAGGAALEGASVLIVPDGGGFPRTVYTDEFGFYSAAVDAGTYSVTASKVGYIAQTLSATIPEGATEPIVVDFTLEVLPDILVTGVVYDGGILDGASHGYPLYAKITYSKPGFEKVVYTEPFTGEYEVVLFNGEEFSVKVEAMVSGYQVLNTTITPTGTIEFVQDYYLNIDVAACAAPGYAPDFDYFFDFEINDGGFVVSGTKPSWQWGTIVNGPKAGHSGTKGIATNLSGNYNNGELSYMTSPAFDLTGYGTESPVIQWWDWKHLESATFDNATLEVSKDGGTTWTAVWGPIGGINDTGKPYSKQTVALDPTYNVTNFMLRFKMKSDSSVNYEGWYIDDLGIGSFAIPPATTVYSEDFEADDGGYVVSIFDDTVTEPTPSWAWGTPSATPGPGSAHSGVNVWATNLTGNYKNYERSRLTSPVIDLSAYAGNSIVLGFWHWMDSESNSYDWGAVEVSNDGGATWTTVFQKFGDIIPWKYKEIVLDPSYAVAGFQLRFYLRTDSSGQYPGWYIDDVTLSYSEPYVVGVECVAQPGGVVAGYVYDKMLVDTKLYGATVQSANALAMTTEHPESDVADGMYWLFQPVFETNTIDFTASLPQYETVTEPVTVVLDQIVQKDWQIGAGLIVADPLALERTIPLFDDPEVTTLDLANIGYLDAAFNISEKNVGFQPYSIPPFEGELEGSTALDSGVDKSASLAGSAIELNSANSSFLNLTGGPMAYVIEVRSTDKLYRIPDVTVPGTWEPVGTTVTYYAGDFLGDDFTQIYAITDTNVLHSINTETGVATTLMNLTIPGGEGVEGIAGAEGFFYGTTSNCSSSTNIFTLDPETGAVEVIVNTSIACGIDLAYVPDNGLLYTVDISTDHLFSINPDTGEVIDVGALGFAAGYAQGMDYDEVNKILYWAAYGSGGNGQLRAIDITTGASTLVGPFTGDNESDCLSIAAYAGGGSGGPVPWLTETPTEGIVPEGQTFPVEIEFNVNGIEQPGDYFAELIIKTDTPYEVPAIPVTMHVIRPLNYGNIKGTVYAYEKCDINPSLVEEATINFYLNGELVHSTLTDANGYFSYALINGTYDVEVVYDGYVSQMISGVVLGWDAEVVLDDIYLRLDAPCLTYTPEAFYQELYPDQMAQQILTFTNFGARETVFEIFEKDGGGPVPFALNKMADVELVVDDGTAEDAIGIGGTLEFMFLNRFTPAADQFPFTLEQVQISFEANDGMQVGDEFRIVIYQNVGGNSDPAVGSELLYQFDVTAENITTWNYYDLPEPVTFEGPGDVLIGVIAMTVPGSSYFPASIDMTASQQRSWAGWWDAGVPAVPTLPPDTEWGMIDSFGFAGNWMVRGKGTTGGGTGGDILWLTVDPMADVVLPDGGSIDVTLTFDATGLTWGDYFGMLNVANEPDPKISIPVQLRVRPFNMQFLPLMIRDLPIPAKN
ncbi:MAG: carboxypeptidase regulatory-like domain-containing protein [Anaerolineaceae bacterium]